MLNATCEVPETPVVDLISHFTILISVPTYTVTLWVLFAKSPAHFAAYRNLLVVHIMSCLLLELHMSIVWKLVVILPWAPMCSTGLGTDFVANCFQLFVLFFIFLGISVVNLFNYRMKVVAEDINPSIRIYIFRSKVVFYTLCFFTFLFICLSYNDLREQTDYKKRIEEKLGKMPDFLLCDSCFFIRFDSIWILLFLSVAYVAIAVVFIQCFVASYVAFKTLMSMKARLSAKTVAIQINFLISLFLMVTVHVLLIAVPTGVFLAALVVVLPESMMPLSYALELAAREHGTASTLVMLLTNKLMLQEVKNSLAKYFPCIVKRKRIVVQQNFSTTLAAPVQHQ